MFHTVQRIIALVVTSLFKPHLYDWYVSSRKKMEMVTYGRLRKRLKNGVRIVRSVCKSSLWSTSTSLLLWSQHCTTTSSSINMITTFNAYNISQLSQVSKRKTPASLSIYFFWLYIKFCIMNFHFIHERCVHFLGKPRLQLMVCCDVVTLTHFLWDQEQLIYNASHLSVMEATRFSVLMRYCTYHVH